jgi:hypothetical protein
LLVGLYITTVIMKNSVKVIKKLRLEIPYNAITPLLGIFPNEI